MIYEVIENIKSYEWGSVWKSLPTLAKEHPIDERLIRLMLLAAWWQAYDDVKDELQKIDKDGISSDVGHFALAYAYLCIGDVTAYHNTLNRLRSAQATWEKNWLQIEFLGRSQQYDKQATFIKDKYKGFMPAYAITALLQSLSHPKADVSFANKKLVNLVDENHPLADALLFRLGAKKNILHLASNINKHYAQMHCLAIGEIDRAALLLNDLSSAGMLDRQSMIMCFELIQCLPNEIAIKKSQLKSVIDSVPHTKVNRGLIGSFGLVFFWLVGDYENSIKFAKYGIEFRAKNVPLNLKPYENFAIWVSKLWHYREHHPKDYCLPFNPHKKVLNVIGESHSLSLANRTVCIEENLYFTNIQLNYGLKLFHLSKNSSSHRKKIFERQIENLPFAANLMLTIGEIDCRPNEGIWKNSFDAKKDYKNIVKKTIDEFFVYFKGLILHKGFETVIIQGVPAPNYIIDVEKFGDEVVQFLSMIKYFNSYFKQATIENGFAFLDVYSLTVGPDQRSNKVWHLDTHHLSPHVYDELDRVYHKPCFGSM